MKVTSMSAHTVAVLNQIAEIERATGMDMPRLMRLIDALKQIPWGSIEGQNTPFEKSMPWFELGMSREAFFNWENLAVDSEAVMLMELIEGDDPNALEEHIENNPVSAKCIIKLVRLAASIKNSELTAGLGPGRILGAETVKKNAASKRAALSTAIEDYIESAPSFSLSAGAITDYIMKRGLNQRYARATVERDVLLVMKERKNKVRPA